ncbi:MAG: zinc ribbon domain-containing protein [Actinomycetia bacterium]|nr:zinc ribbon domain-containing protein [Actinomycetes bacterium]MCP4958123.1 zinc ribbon domain-containing protein [Actinomycetes bacterium]
MNDREFLPEQGAAPAQTTAVRMTRPELAGLLAAAGLQPGSLAFPLAPGVAPIEPSPDSRRALVEAGWFERKETPALTDAGRTVLAILSDPVHRTDLVMGTASWWFTWKGLGGQERDGPVLAVSEAPGDDRLTLSFPHRPGHGVVLLAQHLRVGRIEAPVPLDVGLDDRAFTTWLGVLDDRVEARLTAALDRTPVTRTSIEADDVLAMLAEGRTSGHLGWQVPVSMMVWPDLGTHVGLDDVRSGFEQLVGCGLLVSQPDGRHELSEVAMALVDGLVPVVRWAGFSHTRREPATGTVTTERLVVRRGIGAMLVEQRALGGASVAVRSIDDLGLESLIGALDSTARSGVPAASTPVCGQCRAVLHAEAGFCHRCGAPVDDRSSP